MNLLLLHDEDFEDDGTVRLTGRRAVHARDVLRATHGDALRVGRLGGRIGTGEVCASPGDELRLKVTLDRDPPARAKVDLLLAMPRPKALKKVLPAVASLGVDRLVLLNAARVEKSYFGSDVLKPDRMREYLVLGLEQARDTVLPSVEIRDRFRPFVEDDLDAFAGSDASRWLAHPGADRGLARLSRPPAGGRVVLAVGPEGGWVPFEVQLMEQRGFTPFSLGPRILRVEVAIPVLLGQIALLRNMANDRSSARADDA